MICLRLALNLRRLTAASDLAARENLRAAVYQQVLPPARRFGWFGSTSPGRPCAVAEDGGKDVELDAVWCQVRDTAVSRWRAFASSSQPSLSVSGDKEGGHAASVRTRCDGAQSVPALSRELQGRTGRLTELQSLLTELLPSRAALLVNHPRRFQAGACSALALTVWTVCAACRGETRHRLVDCRVSLLAIS